MNEYTPTTDPAAPLEQPGYHCEPCKKDIPSANLVSHLAGKKHRNRCALLGSMVERPTNLGSPAAVSAFRPAIDHQSTYYCNICARTVFTVLRQQHVNGAIHVRGLAAADGWGGVPEGPGQRVSGGPYVPRGGAGVVGQGQRQRELREGGMWRREGAGGDGESQRSVMVGEIAVSLTGKGKAGEEETRESIDEEPTSDINLTNLSPSVGRKAPSQPATPANPEPAFQGSFEEYLAKTSMEIQLNAKPAHREQKPLPTGPQHQKPTIPDSLTAQWYCSPCTQYLPISERDQHLISLPHLTRATPPNPTPSVTTDNHEATTHVPLPASIDTFFCLPCGTNILKSDRKFHLATPYYCALCDLVMHADTRDIHEWSLEHGRNVEAATAAPVDGGERWHCLTCERSFPVEVRPFHRSRAWTCAVCGMRVHMDWIGAHLMGCARGRG